MQRWFLKKVSVMNYHEHWWTLATDAHEISVQSAVMSGLKDVNSSLFFTRSNMNNFHGHSLKLYKEHFCKVNEYLKFESNFHKKCYQRTIK